MSPSISTILSMKIYLPAFYVAVDHKEKAVVLSIRGTKTLHVREFKSNIKLSPCMQPYVFYMFTGSSN